MFLPSNILLSIREDNMNIRDVRFGNLRKDGKKKIASGKK